jgi:choline dehydrogenase-like flavoprotein
MIEAAQEVREAVLEADVCIVGSGAAGITLALQLIGSGQRVIMLESGADAADPAVQDLYAGEVADEAMHSPPDKYRQRRFGGSTTIWGGRCVPYDPIDFEARPYLPNSGWPISYAEVARYYPAATALCEAGESDYDGATALGPEQAMLAGFHSTRVSTNSLERFSCPTNFAARYGQRLRRAANVRVLTGANCTGVLLQADGRAVRALQVATLAGQRFEVRAARYVLAAGGLETARLLLASRDVAPNGVGNAHDVVGRYYMCHIAGNVGELTVNGPLSAVRHGYEVSPEGAYTRRRFALTPEEQRRLQVGNLVARLHFPNIIDPAHRTGVLSGLYLSKYFISYEYSKRLHGGDQGGLGRYLRHVRNVVSDPFDTLGFVWHWLRKRTLAARKFPSVILRNKSNRFSLEVHGEQEPQRDSRVLLCEQRDALGMPRLRVDWRYSPGDIATVARSLDVIGEELRASGAGELRYNPATLEREVMRYGAYGGHHIGTARMGDDPRTSVVDRDCRVHGVANLYLSGAAVFPTSSQANPTLTIVALALRLADQLRQPAAAAAPQPTAQEAHV